MEFGWRALELLDIGQVGEQWSCWTLDDDTEFFANDVSLQGFTNKPRQTSVYEKRLKESHDSFQRPSTHHTLCTLKVDITNAEKERDCLAKIKREASNALTKHRQVMKTGNTAQPPMSQLPPNPLPVGQSEQRGVLLVHLASSSHQEDTPTSQKYIQCM
ncbi:hypothetical protein DM01DRAFT_1377367 [Hesseltinella vesiculosa]|uniref:Uncharacterized protein n=1 Tax=Hesseltinella vesiculosa TaxID=101127 RepID=A0A1X2G7A2_9FUNG|nr:hypothetical protein DM01DRAFT_1377367 [Hesseltinella vesiculosa]